MPRIDFKNLPRLVNAAYYPHIWTGARFLIIYGGAGSGKSYFIAQRMIYKMMAEAGHNFLVLRQVAATNRFSTFALVMQVIREWHLQSFFRVNLSDYTITFLGNGAQIIFLGLDNSEKIKSITFQAGPLTDVWIEEATEIAEASLNQVNLRLRGLSAIPLQIVLSFNPISSQHWLKKRFFDSQGDDTVILKTTYLDNAFLDAKYRDELERLKEVDPVSWAIYAKGEWGEAGDLVFRSIIFEPCRYRAGDFDEILAGMDFGYNHASALELIGIKDGELYSFRELYVREKTNSDFINLNDAERVLERGQLVTADSAEPKSIEEWRRAGYKIDPAKKGPDSVRAQIGYLNSTRWHIDPASCPGLAAEVRAYGWKKDKFGNVLDEPVAFNDDAIAACRYAVERKLTPKKSAQVYTF